MDQAHPLVSLAGYFATFCFTVQYAPQAWLNWKRKSVKGFNTTGIMIKLIGASYFAVNSALNGEEFSVIVYGAFNIAQHLIFMFQFTLFTDRKIFLLYCFIPWIPYVCGILWPGSMTFTNCIKPICQIVSHLPQLWETYCRKSSEGVSLTTQHLNMAGGLAGLYMYSVIPPKSFFTRIVFINSMFQAISLYSLAIYYDGWQRLIKSFKYFGKDTTVYNRSRAKDDLEEDPNTV